VEALQICVPRDMLGQFAKSVIMKITMEGIFIKNAAYVRITNSLGSK
jgi:hypothetical protein